MDGRLAAHVKAFAIAEVTGRGLDYKLVAGTEIEILHGEKLIEELPVGFAELPEVLPPAGDVGSGMEDDGTLIEEAVGVVLLDDAHDAANELNEGGEVGEDAEYRCDGKEGVVEPFPQLADLDDHIQLVIIETLQDLFVGGAVFSRVHIIGAVAPGAIRFHDLAAVLVVERRRDDLEPVVAGSFAALIQFTDRSVNNSGEGLIRDYDAAPEISVLLAKPTHFFKADLDLLSVLSADIAERSGVEDNGLEALDVAFLNGTKHRVGIEPRVRP